METKTILLIHGAWLIPASLENFRRRFEAAGYAVLAPAWPLMDRPAAALRDRPDPDLGRLSLGRIADHYAAIVAGLPEKPFLIGHSYGGLIVQMLLDRGLGAGGVAVDPAPAAGILAGPRAFRAALPVFLTWASWRRALRMGFDGFARDFGNRLDPAARRAAYDALVVPAPGRLWWQSVLGIGSRIGWANPDRAPLLLIAGEEDRTVEPGMVAQAARKYAKSPARTELRRFAGRGHALILEPGWEEVADAALAFLRGIDAVAAEQRAAS